MNLDDFIVPSSVASPAGLTSEVPIDSIPTITQNRNIPVGKKSRQHTQPAVGTPAASMPKTIANRNRTGEFDYVQRRVRKTSIDEKSVSIAFLSRSSKHQLICKYRIANVERNFHLKYLQRNS